MFFALRKARGEKSAFLTVDYSFDDVKDPIIIDRADIVPRTFMNGLQFALSPGLLEDSISNDIWYLLSSRVVDVLKTARNAEDLNVVPLPSDVQKLNQNLTGYSAIGIRKQLECLDRVASDVRWSSDGRSADAVFDAVIVGDRVPQNCDVFLLKEWPVVPILRDTLGRKLQELRITGLKLQPFGTSTPLQD